MITIILVRHGETEWNKLKRIQGSGSNIPLSETGKLQARQLAQRLKDEKIEAVYSSPLQRALLTAQEIAQIHHLEVKKLDSLLEINAGTLEGALIADLKLRLDEFVCRYDANRELIRPPGGESLPEVQKRAWDTLQNIACQHEGTVVIVSHYFVILSVICRVLNLPLQEITRLRLSTGTVSRFTLDGAGIPRLELFNDGCHLENHLI